MTKQVSDRLARDIQTAAIEHVGLYDAWLEGCDAVEYYTIFNRIYNGQIKLIGQ